LEKAEAIAIFPGVKKAGFVVSQWGRGIISANTRFYEKALSSEDIVFERAGNSPASVGVLKAALARHSN
jgi:hypothetical protein